MTWFSGLRDKVVSLFAASAIALSSCGGEVIDRHYYHGDPAGQFQPSQNTTGSGSLDHELGITDNSGETSFDEVDIEVRDEKGKSLSGIDVHYVTKGNEFSVLAVDRSGKHWPEIKTGKLSSLESALTGDFGKKEGALTGAELIFFLEIAAFGFSVYNVVSGNGKKFVGSDSDYNKYCVTLEQMNFSNIEVPFGVVSMLGAGISEDLMIAMPTSLKFMFNEYIASKYGQQEGYEVWVPKTEKSMCGSFSGVICDLSNGELSQLWNNNLPYWKIVGSCNPENSGVEEGGGSNGNSNIDPVDSDNNRFVDLGNGTVKDSETGLVWGKEVGSIMEHYWAEQYCEDAGGRLPTKSELLGLRLNEKDDGCFISPMFSGKCSDYWSSSSCSKGKYNVGFAFPEEWGSISECVSVLDWGYVRCVLD